MCLFRVISLINYFCKVLVCRVAACRINQLFDFSRFLCVLLLLVILQHAFAFVIKVHATAIFALIVNLHGLVQDFNYFN